MKNKLSSRPCQALARGATGTGAIGSADECPWAHLPVDPESIIHTKEFKQIQRNLGTKDDNVDGILVPDPDGVRPEEPVIVYAAMNGDLPVGSPPLVPCPWVSRLE